MGNDDDDDDDAATTINGKDAAPSNEDEASGNGNIAAQINKKCDGGSTCITRCTRSSNPRMFTLHQKKNKVGIDSPAHGKLCTKTAKNPQQVDWKKRIVCKKTIQDDSSWRHLSGN